jgi:hypothetical protein
MALIGEFVSRSRLLFLRRTEFECLGEIFCIAGYRVNPLVFLRRSPPRAAEIY